MVLSSIDFVFGGGLFYVVLFEGVCTLLLRITYLTSWCTVILILKNFFTNYSLVASINFALFGF